MPSIFTVSGYKVFFWSNENGEPIHVHIAKGKPAPNATKVWLTKSGGCILADNGSSIPRKELNDLLEFISAQFFLIIQNGKNSFWKMRYISTVRFMVRTLNDSGQ